MDAGIVPKVLKCDKTEGLVVVIVIVIVIVIYLRSVNPS
jgi:hypothetical protein